MTTTNEAQSTTLEDMSGTLSYWGPAANTRSGPTVSAAERIVLQRIRMRLAARDSTSTVLTSALDALLDARVLLAAPAA